MNRNKSSGMVAGLGNNGGLGAVPGGNLFAVCFVRINFARAIFFAGNFAGFARTGRTGFRWPHHGNEICSHKLGTIGRYKSLLHCCVDSDDLFSFWTGESAVR